MRRSLFKDWKQGLVLLFTGMATCATCEVVTARYTFAEVYLELSQTFYGLVAEAAGEAERQPRDLSLNGAPIAFSPYTSQRPVDAVLDDYLRALRAHSVPARAGPEEGLPPGMMKQAVAMSARLIEPRVARLDDGTALVTQFFDGNGNAARDYLLARMTLQPGQPPVPGVTVMMRRPAGAPVTDVLASRFDDVPGMLTAFGADADQARLPDFLRPPAGASLVADLGDRGAGIMSRTIIARAARSPEQWASERRPVLETAGFRLEALRGGRGQPLSFGARRGAAEADITYVASPTEGDTIEVIELRQPGLAGGVQTVSGTEGSMP